MLLTKVTDNTHEMSFHELLSQSAQLRIPLFQREYVWTEKQLLRMVAELDSIIEGEDANRFLGAVIGVRRESNPAAPQVFELVDGQQRLTTLYLFIQAAALVAAKNKDDDYATGLINTNLILPWWQNSANTKLVPSYADRTQFAAVYHQLFNTGNLSDWLGARTKLPESTGGKVGRLITQFTKIKNFLQRRYTEFGIEHIQKLVEAATTKLTFVFILLRDPSNATTVFKGLNDPGIPIGIGDLVRNEVFSKISENPELAYSIHRDYWLPFKEKLGENFDNYFFPFAIIHEPGVKNVDLFKGLQKIWKDADNDPKKIIEKLSTYTTEYVALTTANYPDSYDKEVRLRLNRLKNSNAPTSVYPFLMKVLKEHSTGRLPSASVCEILDSIESFLVRRAVVGIEPTGLLVMFRTLWQNIEQYPTKTELSNVIKKRTTIDWPDDDKFVDAIKRRGIYQSNIASYVLIEYEKSLNADFPEGNTPWIEHVMPQTLTEEWSKVIEKHDHDALIHTWGNLVPLTAKMNQGVSQDPYEKKRVVFSKDSMYASARRLASNYENWNAQSIQERSALIAEWAKNRWAK